MKSASFWDQADLEGISIKWDQWNQFMGAFELMYRGLVEDKQLIQRLKDSKFDLGMAEYFELGALGVFELVGIKTSICAAALGMIGKHYQITGLPHMTSFVPGGGLPLG